MLNKRTAQLDSWSNKTVAAEEKDDEPVPILDVKISCSVTKLEFRKFLVMHGDAKAADFVAGFFIPRKGLACLNATRLSFKQPLANIGAAITFGRRKVKISHTSLKNIVAQFQNDGIDLTFRLTVKPSDDDLPLFFHSIAGETIGFECNKVQGDLLDDDNEQGDNDATDND